MKSYLLELIKNIIIIGNVLNYDDAYFESLKKDTMEQRYFI